VASKGCKPWSVVPRFDLWVSIGGIRRAQAVDIAPGSNECGSLSRCARFALCFPLSRYRLNRLRYPRFKKMPFSMRKRIFSYQSGERRCFHKTAAEARARTTLASSRAPFLFLTKLHFTSTATSKHSACTVNRISLLHRPQRAREASLAPLLQACCGHGGVLLVPIRMMK